MKVHIFLFLFGVAFLSQYCSNGQNRPAGAELAAADFSEKLKATPNAILLDVRTQEEFEKGHLPGALNIDWRSDDFAAKTAKLDKSKPVLVYCLSGGRSSAAAEQMRSEGFQVFELEGGIMKWRAANLPESKGNAAKTAGMSRQAYDDLLKSDKLVLVDFYADWCEPCKKMAPYLAEIKNDMSAKVDVVRINADDNQAIVKELGLNALPVLLIYKNGQQLWRHDGFIGKDDVVARLGAL